MNSHPMFLGRRRKSEHAKWVHLIFAMLLIAGIKVLFRDTAPAPSLGNIEESVVGLGVAEGNDTTGDAVRATKVRAKGHLLRQAHEPGTESSTEAPELAAEIKDCLNASPPEIIKARNRLNEMLSAQIGNQRMDSVREQLARLSGQWLFSEEVFPDDKICGGYGVRFGDTFTAIEQKFKVPYEMLMHINNIKAPTSLRAGKTIKVIHGPFQCKVYRSACRMDLSVQNVFVRSFSISFDKGGMEIPARRLAVKVGGKHISPARTGPTARWIALESIEGDAKDRMGLVITGTKNSEEAGIAASEECIRLSDEDLELIYDLLMPKASQVIVGE